MGKPVIGTMVTIDEALVKTQFGKFNYLVILLSGLVLNNVILETVGISFTLPILECDLGLSYKQQGIIGSVGFFGMIVSSHLWGFLADTTGRKRIMLPALLLECCVNIVASLSPNFIILAFMRFLNGILVSAGSAAIFAYLSEFHSYHHRSRAILSSAFISAFAAIFMPVMAWGAINQTWSFYIPLIGITFRPWRLFMLACGTQGFLAILLLFFLPESPKYLLCIGRAEEALEVLQRIYRMNTSGNPKLRGVEYDVKTLLPDSETPIKNSEKNPIDRSPMLAFLNLVWKQTSPLFMREHLRKTVLASIIQFIIFFTAHGVYMWFPYILNKTMQFSERNSEPMRLCDILRFTQTSNFTLMPDQSEKCAMHLEGSTYIHTLSLELIYVAFLLIISFTIERIGRKTIFFLIMSGCGICGIIGLLIKIPLLSIYILIVFLCCGLGTTVVNAIVVDIFPTNLRAMAVCISLMMGRIGSVSGSNLLGIFIDTNCELALYGSAVALIVAGLLGILLPKSKSEENIKCDKI